MVSIVERMLTNNVGAIHEITPERIEELYKFVSLWEEKGYDDFKEAFAKDRTKIGSYIIDLYLLPPSHREAQERFYEAIIKKTEELKELNASESIKKLLIKRKNKLAREMDIFGDDYMIVKHYTYRDTKPLTDNEEEYNAIVLAIPVYDKQKKRDVFKCSTLIDEMKLPALYFWAIATYKLYDPD